MLLSEWFNNNSAGIQALSTLALVAITIYYAWQTRRQAELLRSHAEAQLKPKLKFIAKEMNYWVPEGEESQIKVKTNLANIGVREVKIISSGVFSNKGTTTTMPDYKINYPLILKPGDSIIREYDIEELADPFLFVFPDIDDEEGSFAGFYFEDATGEVYKYPYNLKTKIKPERNKLKL